MIAVIQCAASKQPGAGRLHTHNGAQVCFVADPELARNSAGESPTVVHARPDDPSDGRGTWRDVLVEYNRQSDSPLGLLPAGQLYRNAAYGGLVERYGIDKVYDPVGRLGTDPLRPPDARLRHHLQPECPQESVLQDPPQGGPLP